MDTDKHGYELGCSAVLSGLDLGHRSNAQRAWDATQSRGWVPLSLAPGFSRVSENVKPHNRFSGFPFLHTRQGDGPKPLKRLPGFSREGTRLKPGANERETAWSFPPHPVWEFAIETAGNQNRHHSLHQADDPQRPQRAFPIRVHPCPSVVQIQLLGKSHACAD